MKNKKFYIYLVFFLLFSNYSFAYLDPGLISIFLQGIIAAIAAASAFIALYWSKIVNFFNKNEKANKDENEK